MQVTHAQDYVTHAVIARHDTISFGISDSPEFFQILSSTLYTDQQLAVVREVLCNAWDAHIAAGCTDKSISIELGENLVIRDYGPGIPDELIGEVYGTYGNSTKKNDGQQTGGFGLGCKAPFAYTDHFEVVSHHGGTKTIYSISKSSAERNGKPGITPIVSLPTTETGLQVTIPIKPDDRWRFENLIEKIVRNGEMLAHLGGRLLPTLPFSKMQGTWLITKELTGAAEFIFVRYGNVIYPVPIHDSYKSDYNQIQEFLIKLGARTRPQHALVLQAAPHSISVTPSREALSLQDRTVSTLGSLLASFNDMVSKGMTSNFMKVLKEQVNTAVEEGNLSALFNPMKHVPKTQKAMQELTGTTIITLDELALAYLKNNYPGGYQFHHEDMKYRLDSALKLKLGKRGHVEELKNNLDAHNSPNYAYDWFLRRLAGPLLAKLMNNPVLDPKRMFIYEQNHIASNHHNLVPIRSYEFHNLHHYIPLLRNIMILTYSRAELGLRCMNHPVLRQYGQLFGAYVYVAPLLKNKIQEMRDFFTKQGYILVDLTVPQPDDKPKPVRVKAPKVEKLTGYPSLAGCITPGRRIRVDNCFLDGAPRVNSPKCFVPVVYSRALDRPLNIELCDSVDSKRLIHLYGADCAVVRTDKTEQELIAAGVPRLRAYMVEDVVKQLTTSPNILAYWEESVEVAFGDRGHLLSTYHKELDNLLKFPEVRNALGLTVKLANSEMDLLKLWQHLLVYRAHYFHKELMPLDQVIQNVKLSPVMQNIKKTVNEGSLYKLVNIAHIRDELKSPLAKPPGYKDRIGLLLKTALMS